MIRLSQVVIVAGAVTFAACSDVVPTSPEPGATPEAPRDLVVLSAPVPGGSCTVTPNGASFDVTVSWSNLSVSAIDLWQANAGQPLLRVTLGHPTRNGNETYTVLSEPDFATLTGHPNGIRLNCVTVT